MINVEERLRALASGTSRRGLLARFGRGLVGAALLSNLAPLRAAATNCSCTGNAACGGFACGSQLATSNICCNCSTGPCFDCSVGCSAHTNCTGATCCVGSGFTPGWYWYCCIPGPHLPESVTAQKPASSLRPLTSGNLWKCQDCCNNFGDCYTSRDIVATC